MVTVTGPSSDPAPAPKCEPKREINAFEKYPLKALKVLSFSLDKVSHLAL